MGRKGKKSKLAAAGAVPESADPDLDPVEAPEAPEPVPVPAPASSEPPAEPEGDDAEEPDEVNPLADDAPAGPASCSHVRTAVKPSSVKTALNRNRTLSCIECDKGDDDESWVCLFCGNVGCGRDASAHALEHYKKMGVKHSLAVNLSDRTIWCYKCDVFLSASALKEQDKIEEVGGILEHFVAKVQKSTARFKKENPELAKKKSKPVAAAEDDSKPVKTSKVIAKPKAATAASEEKSEKVEKPAKVEKTSEAAKTVKPKPAPAPAAKVTADVKSETDTEPEIEIADVDTDALALAAPAKGLVNLGNTCFMNSILQCLVELEPLKKSFGDIEVRWDGPLQGALRTFLKDMRTSKGPGSEFQADEDEEDEDEDEESEEEEEEVVDDSWRKKKPGDRGGKPRGKKLSGREKGMAAKAEKSKKKEKPAKKKKKKNKYDTSKVGSYNPSAIFHLMTEKNPRFRGNRQQDSHELLRSLVDNIREERLSSIVEARKKLAREVLKRWTDDDVKEWFLSIGMESAPSILEKISAAGKKFSSADLIQLLSSWTAKATKELKKLILPTNEKDKDLLIRELRAITTGNSEFVKTWAYRELGSIGNDPGAGVPAPVVDNVFKGTLVSRIKCLTCETLSTTDEPFYDLSLAIEPPPKIKKVKGGYVIEGDKSKKGKKKDKRAKEEFFSESAPAATKSESETEETVALSDSKKIGFARLEGSCNLLDCLAAFLDEEVLEGADAYGCAECTKRLKREGKAEDPEHKLMLEQKLQEEAEAKIAADEAAAAALEDEKDVEEKGLESPDEKVALEEKKDDFGIPEEEEGKDKLSRDLGPLVLRRAVKQYFLKELPPVLTLHLKRFRQVGTKFEKSSKDIRFPLELELGKYTLEGKPAKFRLVGVSQHMGGLGGGHYVAHVCKHFAKQKKAEDKKAGDSVGQWFHFSDSHFHAETVSGVSKAEAYVLFYVKEE